MIVKEPLVFPTSGLEARAYDVGAKLEALVEDNLLSEKNLRGKALDIGLGYGGSYIALSRYSLDVIGIEPRKDLAQMLVDNRVVPRDKIYVGDPLDFLRKQKNDTFDFIAGLHLFSENYGLQIEQFHKEAVRTLRKGGQLLFSAERDTSSGNDYSRRLMRLMQLPTVEETTAELIEDYKIGPDDILYILTKH